ncbi:MAG TPA: hypothetical protein VLM91_22625 [Candidatus Methylomirabilis sp.]|nr:hypothetical protein [Candidatus Methylomirabilis sp.]
MRSRRSVGWLLGLVVLATITGLGSTSQAAEEVIFGPAQYIRTSGPPNQFMETVSVPPTLAAPFRLHI